MRTRDKILILVGIVLGGITTVFFIFSGLSYVMFGIDDVPRQILDVQMDVTGIKPVYDIGESITFSVNVNALGTFVPWPDFRIYKDKYVDSSSQPVYSRMYMTSFESADKMNNIQTKWREKTWTFPLDEDTGNPMVEGDDDGKIRFFEEGKYILRVNAWAKQEQLIEFQVIDSSK